MKDSWGAACSGLCAAHCLFTPLIAAAGGLGLLGLMMRSELVHLALIACAAAMAAVSFPFSFKRHRRLSPGLFGASGLGLLAIASGLHGAAELAFSLGGAGLLSAGHLLNRRLLLISQASALR